MKRTFIVMAMVIALALSALAPAMANNSEGRQGNNACFGVQGVGGQEFANPGEMFRHIQEVHGMGPGEWIEARQADTVGEFIYNRCVVHNPNA